VRTGLVVRSISQQGGVRIETSDGTIEAGQVVVCPPEAGRRRCWARRSTVS